jgi:ABC-type transport system involved in cytochrome bd biosynthesis fused ATPase/permease subunit
MLKRSIQAGLSKRWRLRLKTLLARAVLDEPTDGLDAASEADMLLLIRALHEAEG